MNNDINAQFLCKDCERYNLCRYYDRRKEDSYICKYFHLPTNKSHWNTYRDSDRCECAKCGHQIHFEYPYCPNCGADMRGE